MKTGEGSFFQFGDFRLDPVKRILSNQKEQVLLSSRAFETLLALVRNSGRTMEKSELMELVWGEVAVEENNLTQCISALRKALGEKRGENQFIITVPRVGYRFIVPVQEEPVLPLSAQSRSPQSDMPAEAQELSDVGPVQQIFSAPESARIALDRPWIARLPGPQLMILSAALVIAVGLAGWLLRPWISPVKPSGTGAHRISIAVLPFANISGDPTQDYLGEGLASEVINRLGRPDQQILQVVGGSTLAQNREGILHTEQKLDVRYTIEGSVTRSGGHLRVLARLIRIKDQSVIWAKSYSSRTEDAAAAQREIAKLICKEVESRLGKPPAPTT